MNGDQYDQMAPLTTRGFDWVCPMPLWAAHRLRSLSVEACALAVEMFTKAWRLGRWVGLEPEPEMLRFCGLPDRAGWGRSAAALEELLAAGLLERCGECTYNVPDCQQPRDHKHEEEVDAYWSEDDWGEGAEVAASGQGVGAVSAVGGAL